MKQIPRRRPLAPEDSSLFKAIRDQVVEEVPELLARHERQMAGFARPSEESGAGLGELLAPSRSNEPI